MERTRLERENWVLRRALSQRASTVPELVGRSIVAKGLQAALHRLAAVPSTVLLTGESGSGKGLAALVLHRSSPRAAAPFVPVSCASMQPALADRELFGQVGRRGDDAGGAGALDHDGLFIYAQGGTLFLDDIGDLPLPLQASLLRAVEDRHIRPVGSEHEIPVDVRIVAATSRPLKDEVEAGRFRKDLYYRLQVMEINLPPLRAHKEDIPDLVAHFIATLSQRLGVPPIEVTPDEMRYLSQYDWPGTVRELRNLIERSLIVGALNVSALYPGGSAPGQGVASATQGDAAAPTDLSTLEKRHILAVLESVDGDKSRAAALLGISRRTLERRFAEWRGG
jgi:DNA-binding NtrC family response regulator